MADVKPGQVFVPGTSAKVARQLLEGAKKAGLDPKLAVRTTEGGFIVPEAALPGASEPAEKPPAPDLPADKPSESDPSPAPPRRRRKKNPQKGT